jgi:hypothetical protein
MSKFGKKFTCWKCSTKFYDLNKPQAKCPKCGANPEDDPNKGIIVAAPPAAADEFADEVEEVPEEVTEDEDLDDEPAEEDPAGGDADDF